MSNTDINDPSFIIPDNKIKGLADMPTLATLVDRVAVDKESYRLSRLLQDLLLSHVWYGKTEGFTELGRHEFVNSFRTISDVIYDLEKYAEDYNKGLGIRQYLQLVTKASDHDLNQANSDIELLRKKYGSLQNGLENLSIYQSKGDNK